MIKVFKDTVFYDNLEFCLTRSRPPCPQNLWPTWRSFYGRDSESIRGTLQQSESVFFTWGGRLHPG